MAIEYSPDNNKLTLRIVSSSLTEPLHQAQADSIIIKEDALTHEELDYNFLYLLERAGEPVAAPFTGSMRYNFDAGTRLVEITHTFETTDVFVQVYEYTEVVGTNQTYQQLIPARVTILNNSQIEILLEEPNQVQGFALVGIGGTGPTSTAAGSSGPENAYISSSLNGNTLSLDRTAGLVSDTIDLSSLALGSNANVRNYNTQNRYTQTIGSNTAQIMSTGTSVSILSWTRSGTTITMTSPAHGLSNQDHIIVRNTSTPSSQVEVTVVDVDTFTFTTTNAGDTSGAAATYVPIAKVTQFDGRDVNIQVPSAGDVEINSVSLYWLTSEETSINLSITGGVGANTSISNLNIPSISAWNLSAGISSQIGGATVIVNTSSNFGEYSLEGGLDTFGPLNVKLIF